MKPGRILVGIAVVTGLLGAGWWVGDRSGPRLAVQPTEALSPRGSIQLSIEASDSRTGLGSVEALVDGNVVELLLTDGRGDLSLDTAELPDGRHELVVKATDRRGNTTEQILHFTSDNTPPTLTVARSSRSAAQGRTLAFFVRIDEPVARVDLQGLGRVTALLPRGDGLFRGMIGIPSDHEPGTTVMRISAVDLAGNQAESPVDVEIVETDFPRGGMIQLSGAQKAARKDRTAIDDANSRRRAAYNTELAEDLWSEPFETPVDGILTSPFGKVRTYSDGRVSRHLGTDLAASRGTEVRSPADGVVVLSEAMVIYGEVVVVKHGAEVSTSYNHLSARDVEAGDRVERGGVLGEVGSTGQSTGPHLHWGMVVGGVAVAAEQWTEEGFGDPRPGDFAP